MTKKLVCRVCGEGLSSSEAEYPIDNGVQLGPMCKECFHEYVVEIEYQIYNEEHDEDN